MINYLSVKINPPPLDKKIIVKKDIKDCSDAFMFDDGAKVVELADREASLDWHCLNLLSDGYTLWAEV